MKVLVDTSVWSLALRRGPAQDSKLTSELGELISEGRIVMIGAIRQELLSGIREDAQYKNLRKLLRSFPDVPLEESDYEAAASCFNRCRAKGIQGSNTDFLICAASMRREFTIFTTDSDFARYAEIIAVKLYQPR